jgi:Fic family protein
VTDAPEIKARLEAAGHQAALSYVDRLAEQKTSLYQVELLKIHRLIFSQSWPDIAGRFRIENVEIAGTSYLPPHWRQVPILVYQALGALNYRLARLDSDDVQCIIGAAAQVHYDIAAIHPFRDGNGRVARLVLNYVFRYFDLPYVVIPREERDRYLDALEAANRGDMALFTDFVAEQYEHSLDQVLDQTSGQTSTAGE